MMVSTGIATMFPLWWVDNLAFVDSFGVSGGLRTVLHDKPQHTACCLRTHMPEASQVASHVAC